MVYLEKGGEIISENKSAELKEILDSVRRIEGVAFAGQINPALIATRTGASEATDKCTCQNCACFSNRGGACGCKPDCTCEGRTAIVSDFGSIFDNLIGVATILPMEDVKTLVGLRDKMLEMIKNKDKGKS